MRFRGALVFFISFVFIMTGCGPSESYETKRWERNLNECAGAVRVFPSFEKILKSHVDDSSVLREEAQSTKEGKSKAKLFRLANESLERSAGRLILLKKNMDSLISARKMLESRVLPENDRQKQTETVRTAAQAIDKIAFLMKAVPVNKAAAEKTAEEGITMCAAAHNELLRSTRKIKSILCSDPLFQRNF